MDVTKYIRAKFPNATDEFVYKLAHVMNELGEKRDYESSQGMVHGVRPEHLGDPIVDRADSSDSESEGS